ncbi:acyltransferase family protein [Corynebacterium sp.]|uniref:acyltransferase family protein n=1 Tax=Corynebacterium sp. TaxID=1720 RepID=UPI0019AD7FE2|nr:acyltransferase family protein [Corynebacterium sp.]HHU67852.1 acyltransferase family protein [Corynebacterium sp.]
MRWPDVAKGLSILGVVLLHIVIMVPGGMDGTAAAVTRVLDPLRMPLFFMVSGFFSAKVLNFTFRELFLRRLWFLLVPYVLWVPVELWLSHRVRATYQDIEMPGAMLYVMRTVEGWNPYWFLYGLILFNLVLWATRKWPPWAAMLVSFSPILLLPAFADMPLVTRVVMYLPVFMGAVHLRRHIRAWAERATELPTLSVSILLYAAGLSLSAVWGWWTTSHPGADLWYLPGAGDFGTREVGYAVKMTVQILMLPVAVIASVLISRIPVVTEALSFLGRHTLVIYLGHPLAFIFLYQFPVRKWGLEISRQAENPLLQTWVWMTLCFVMAAVGSWVVHLLTRIPYLRWTIMPPQLVAAPRRPVSAAGVTTAATTTASVTTR